MIKGYVSFSSMCLLVVLYIAAGNVPGADAQIKSDKKDTLKYELLSARQKVDPPAQDSIEVEFGKTLPQEYANPPVDLALKQNNPNFPDVSRPIDTGTDWLIKSISKDEKNPVEDNFTALSVRVTMTGLTNDLLVLLEVPPGKQSDLELSTHRVFIFYRKGNFPFVEMLGPKGPDVGESKGSSYVAANNKDQADIYFSGKAVGAQGSKPSYSFESKLGYFKEVGKHGTLGLQGTMDADQASDADPDSIKAVGAYERRTVYAPASSVLIHIDVGGEFDRKNKNRNLITTTEALWVLPPTPLGKTTNGAITLLAGIEAGNNFRNALKPNGIGSFYRAKFAANAYLVALRTPLFQAIHISGGWQVRLPSEAEIFSEKVKGVKDPVLSLTKKPRHNVGVDTDFMFSKAFGLTIQYRWGSLPPAFNMVDHKVTAGIKIQLSQINR